MKRLSLSLIIVLLLCCVSGCQKNTADDENEGTLPEASPSEVIQENPFIHPLAAFLEAKDGIFAKILAVADGYQGGGEENILPLIVATLSVPGRADNELYEALVQIAGITSKEGDGWISEENDGKIAYQEEKLFLTCSYLSMPNGEDEEGPAKHLSGFMKTDASQLSLEIRMDGEVNPVLLSFLEYQKQGDGYACQYWVSEDRGEHYLHVKMFFSQEEMEYVIYEGVRQKPESILDHSIDTTGFLKEGMTSLVYREGKLIIRNNGKEYAL